MTATPNDVHALQDMPPLLHYRKVWHIGTTILTQKKPDSHAGSGLAVSRHPQSWRRIAGLAAPLFRFEKASGAFVDMHACLRLPQLMREVWAWAQAERYVTWQPLYQVRYYDTEEEGWHLLPFLDEGQARAEYRALRDDEREAQFDTLLGYAPTERMRAAMLHSTPPLAFVQDFALFLFAEAQEPRLDGVWWADEHRPELLSAPHGAIFRHQLPSWRKTLAEG
jgi:hypothetical protein